MYICLDLGATNLRGTWVDSRARIGEIQVVKRPRSLSGSKSVLLELIRQLMAVAPGPVQGIGLASAGPLDNKQKVYLKTANMRELDYFPVGDFLSSAFSLPVCLENDAQAAVLGENWKGCLQGEDDCLLLTLGTGVGSGVVLGGRLFRAGHVTGPELGHLFLAEKKGRRCGCGQTGCAELWLGKQGVFDLLHQEQVSCTSLRQAHGLCLKGHPGARSALGDYGYLLGVFLARLQVVFGVPAIGLSGGLSVFFPFFKDALWDALRGQLAQRQWWLPKKIRQSKDPDKSALLGMARICAQERGK